MSEDSSYAAKVWGRVRGAAATAGSEVASAVENGAERVVNPSHSEHPVQAAVTDNLKRHGEALVNNVVNRVDAVADNVDAFVDAEAVVMRYAAKDLGRSVADVAKLADATAHPLEPKSGSKAKAAAEHLLEPTLLRIADDPEGPEVASAITDIILEVPHLGLAVVDGVRAVEGPIGMLKGAPKPGPLTEAPPKAPGAPLPSQEASSPLPRNGLPPTRHEPLESPTATTPRAPELRPVPPAAETRRPEAPSAHAQAIPKIPLASPVTAGAVQPGAQAQLSPRAQTGALPVESIRVVYDGSPVSVSSMT